MLRYRAALCGILQTLLITTAFPALSVAASLCRCRG